MHCLTYLSTRYLYGNALSGQIPDNLKGCSNLREMKLQNNELSGPIPGNAVWGAMKWSLTTLYLQGNKLTGSVPPFLFELAIYSDAPFSSLNLGENQLSGDLPIKHTMQGKTYKLANKFAELWLLGNNWEGGPCAALCGANAGKLDDVKRTTSKDYATKCLENTDSHVNLLESEYTIDELGRCSLKSPTCTAGYFFEPSRTIVEPDCKRCPLNTYQAQSDHTNPACVDQPTCGVGEKIVGVVSAVEARSCELCTSGKYQDVSDHRLATCSDQPKCNAGQKIDEPSTEQRRKCSACELGKFQDDAKHTRQSCKPQMPCNPGEEFDISPTKPRECKPCSDNEYQDSTDEDAFVLRCIAQPVCMSGQYISEDSKTARRKCNACPGGQYQEKQDHRELQCKLHELCPAGTEFENTYTEERRCTACGPNTYQDKDKDKDALQTFCFDQPTCQPGEEMSRDTTTARRKCSACLPGYYQDETGHRETLCKKQPTCSEGTQYEDSVIKKRVCSKCDPNQYQVIRGTVAECIDQPFCRAGQYMSPDSATKLRKCETCKGDTYQDKTQHRQEKCKQQPVCDPGYAFTTSDRQKRTCALCARDQYALTALDNSRAECIPQPNLCGVGQKMSIYSLTAPRSCDPCPADQYNENVNHTNTVCSLQPKCGKGTSYKATNQAERRCEDCPDNTYQDDANHRVPECKAQTPCPAQFKFVGGSNTTQGQCEPCEAGTSSPSLSNGYNAGCIDDTTGEIRACSEPAGELVDGKCECKSPSTGVGPTCSEYSNEKTCAGYGTVSYNIATKMASCSGCDDPAVAVGDGCQFSNTKTCKDFGVVLADGTCDWNQNNEGEPIVSECGPGSYYNPHPETPDNEEDADENAIAAGIDGCYPCSPGQYANGTERRVQCDQCPPSKTSEPASTSEGECFAKFESAAASQSFCFGKGSIEEKPLSRITTRDDCKAFSESSGWEYAGEFVVPFPGCIHDEQHGKVRFYVDKANTAAVAGNGAADTLEESSPPYQGVPQCENFVCPNPANDVTALTSDLTNADKSPRCTISIATIEKAVQEESAKNREEFVPALVGINIFVLAGSYYRQFKKRKELREDPKDSGFWHDHWMHIHVWLVVLRVVDMMSDFGFFFISVLGIFLETFGDGDPETNPYTEPKVAAFLYAQVFVTALGILLMPLDLWVHDQRDTAMLKRKQDVDKEPAKNADEPATFCSKLTIFFSTQTKIETPMNIIHIYIMVCISLLEDLPQMAFAGTYVTTMNNAGLDLDGVAVFSMFLSTISVVFSIATVGLHISAHRASEKPGWWKVKVLNIHELVTLSLDSRKDQKSARRKSVGSYSELTCDADRDAFINSKIKVVVTSPKLRESLNNNSTMLKTFRKSLSGVHYFPNLEDDQRSKLSTREQLEGKTRQTNPLYSVEANTGSEVQIDLTAINPQYGVEANTGSEEQIDSIYPQDVYDGFDSEARGWSEDEDL